MSDLSHCRVLLVDDVKDNINILVEALRGEYKLGFALDGQAALNFAQAKAPDLILLDIMMPGMDGYEVCRRLKDDPATREIPVLFITAMDEIENKTEAFSMGAVDYITKPFEIQEVKARVRTHLSLCVARRTLAVQRDRLKQSLSLAMEVQQSLIPKKDPEVEGLDLAGQVIYCDETGGDYYDFLDRGRTGSGRIGVVVGDVSEHGIQSALLMTSARAFLRQRSVMPGSLAEVTADVNRQLARDLEETGRFMTLFLCEVDAGRGLLSWVRAGHDPALLFDPENGTFEELSGQGAPLGVVEDFEFEEQSRALSPGQVILIGTDGIWEARNPAGSFFGKDRLKEIVSENAAFPAARIKEEVIERLAEFRQGRPIADDVTLVVIKVINAEF